MAWPRWPRHRNTSRCRGFFSCFPAASRALSGRPQCQRIEKCPSSARPCHEWQAEVPVERKCWMPDSAIQRFSDSAIQRFSDSAIQRFRDSAIQRFRDSAIPRFRDSAIPRFRDVPMSRCPDVPMSRCPDVPMSRCPNAPTSFAPRVFSQGRVSTHCPCGVRFSDHPVLQHADINHVVARINETSKRHC